MADFDYRPGAGLEDSLRAAERASAEANEMKRRIGEVVGRAEAAEGRIYAEYTNEGGLSALDLDPRALRLPSDELSREIRSAVNAAFQDYNTKVSEVTTEIFGGSTRNGLPDPAIAMAQLEKATQAFATPMKELMRELGVQQQRAKSAMEQMRDPRQGY